MDTLDWTEDLRELTDAEDDVVPSAEVLDFLVLRRRFEKRFLMLGLRSFVLKTM